MFLYEDLEEEIYMKQPEGFTIKGKKELVCNLNKYIYGIRKSLGRVTRSSTNTY